MGTGAPASLDFSNFFSRTFMSRVSSSCRVLKLSISASSLLISSKRFSKSSSKTKLFFWPVFPDPMLPNGQVGLEKKGFLIYGRIRRGYSK